MRRYKRFLADIELDSGPVVVAHCPNPGSMLTCAPQGARVWLDEHASTTRKLAYTWELVEAEGAMVCVNTARANSVVAEALQAGTIAELCDYEDVVREVRYGEKSRIDFLLRQSERTCYLEVKSVTLRGGPDMVAFPDSVTARGTRHLHELMAMVGQGHRAVLLFCCNRSDARAVRPADEIDPRYGHALRQAIQAGVEVLAYRCDVSPGGIWVRERIPVVVPALDAPLLPVPAAVPSSRPSLARVSLAASHAPGERIKLGAKKKARLRQPGNAYQPTPISNDT